MAGRVRPAARNHVGTVGAVCAGGVDELASLGQGSSERTPERNSRLPAQFMGVLGQRDDDLSLVQPNRYLIVGEFLDQERGCSVTYGSIRSRTS